MSEAIRNAVWSAPPVILQPVTSSPGSVSLPSSRFAIAWFSGTSNESGVVISGSVLGASVVLVTDRLLRL